MDGPGRCSTFPRRASTATHPTSTRCRDLRVSRIKTRTPPMNGQRANGQRKIDSHALERRLWSSGSGSDISVRLSRSLALPPLSCALATFVPTRLLIKLACVRYRPEGPVGRHTMKLSTPAKWPSTYSNWTLFANERHLPRPNGRDLAKLTSWRVRSREARSARRNHGASTTCSPRATADRFGASMPLELQ